MRTLTYAKAIGLALAEAMETDEHVFVMGEDVGVGGGAYGATQGLLEQFGPERVRDTPISESAIVGYGVGAALAGLRPVVELMHMDFVTYAMDQIVNQAAKLRYMFGAKACVPLVIRTPAGGWLTAAAQHSQSLEAWFTHIPGLKVAAAATPADVRNILHAAIRDDNPVVLLEPLYLYEAKGEMPDAPEEIPLGQADVKRRGDDVSLVSWGGTVPIVLEAADTLAAQGIAADVIDLLSLMPWDIEAVLSSVRRTNRVVVVHQASLRGGFGAEVAAVISERAFDYLDAPVARVGALNTPVPFSPPLEAYVLPNAERVVDAVHRMT
ncbi:MAG: alpha-ketoacid dehydrogenase subunit beta [Anaerolineae bacterium]|jgi:pyruvate/2-oxoglutarate/acetoin dehydrogenase E1 component